jgi:hypothetical protein
MSCTGFSSSSTVYAGALGAFPTAWATGSFAKPGGAGWAQAEAADYRFTIIGDKGYAGRDFQAAWTSPAFVESGCRCRRSCAQPEVVHRFSALLLLPWVR